MKQLINTDYLSRMKFRIQKRNYTNTSKFATNCACHEPKINVRLCSGDPITVGETYIELRHMVHAVKDGTGEKKYWYRTQKWRPGCFYQAMNIDLKNIEEEYAQSKLDKEHLDEVKKITRKQTRKSRGPGRRPKLSVLTEEEKKQRKSWLSQKASYKSHMKNYLSGKYSGTKLNQSIQNCQAKIAHFEAMIHHQDTEIARRSGDSQLPMQL